MNDFPLSASDCRDLLSGLPAGIVLCDARDQVIWANESFCELLETDPEAIVGADMSAVLGRDSDPVRTQVDRYVVTSDSGKSRWLVQPPAIGRREKLPRLRPRLCSTGMHMAASV